MHELEEEWKPLAIIVVVFLACFICPWARHVTMPSSKRFTSLVQMVRPRACSPVPDSGLLHRRRHLGLRQPGLGHEVPGGQGQQGPGLRRGLGLRHHSGRVLLHGVAAFAGIYRMGAGLGPACAFLYSGPAINVLAARRHDGPHPGSLKWASPAPWEPSSSA